MRRPGTGLALLLSLTCLGCGSAQPAATSRSASASASAVPAASTTRAQPRAHPQVVEPVAGATGAGAVASAGAPAAVSVGPAGGSLAQPVSDQVVRQELAASGLSASERQATLTPDGLAIAPIGAPAAVQSVIQAGNEIAHLPYRFGGGHGTFEDSAYDCSGSLSFVFAAAGLLDTTVTSGQLMSWGKPGPGRWITVFAAPGHTFMYVAGLRFDTVALAQTGSRWSSRPATEPDLRSFVVRHPAGL